MNKKKLYMNIQQFNDYMRNAKRTFVYSTENQCKDYDHPTSWNFYATSADVFPWLQRLYLKDNYGGFVCFHGISRVAIEERDIGEVITLHCSNPCTHHKYKHVILARLPVDNTGGGITW